MIKALLLDRNYMAISIVTWKRAMILMAREKAEIISKSSKSVTSASGKKFIIPSILRLLIVVPFRAYSNRMKFNRKNVLIRDNYKCQYCDDDLSKKGGTIDHVVPRSKGGANDYLNCVACCKKCNNIKGNNIPSDMGMLLRKQPRKPSFISLYRNFIDEIPSDWADYIIGI